MNPDHAIGCLFGVAVGDSLGLPYEGLSRQRGQRMLGPPDRQRLLFGYGMVSDDTEQNCLVAQALIDAKGDVSRFQQSLARRLRWWFAGLPGGIGLATARAIVRLWFGFSPAQSGVYSAGNGAAMRAPLLGVVVDDLGELRHWVQASSMITHSDPKADWGAFAVSVATWMACRHHEADGDLFLATLRQHLGPSAGDFLVLIEQTVHSVAKGQSTQAFADDMGLLRGVTGFVYHTVPIAIHAWLSNPHDYRSGVTAVIECGGDTDTTAAITGGIIGAAVGAGNIPQEWRNAICEWPRTVSWMTQLATQLSEPASQAHPVESAFPSMLLRNMVFIAVVLTHGIRRLAPPY